MPEDGVIVPAGMVPLDSETGKVEAGYEEQAEALANSTDEATTEETSSETTDTTESTEASTDETTDAGDANAGTEDNTSTEAPVAETSQEDDPDDSSLNDDGYIPLSEIFDEYDNSKGEDEPSMSELIARKYRDLDSLDPIDLIEEGMIFETPGISDDELDVATEKFETLFLSEEEIAEKIEDGDISERDLKILKAEYERTVRKYRDILQEDKESIELPGITTGANQNAEQTSAGLTEEQVTDIKNDLNDYLKDYAGETLKVVSKEGDSLLEFNYEVDDAARDEVVNLASNPQNVYGMWTNEDGTINREKYVSDMIKLTNFDKMMKAVHDQATAARTEDIIKNTNNITDVKTKSGGGDAKTPTAHDHILGHYDR